jgi:hypothetical protein
MTPKVATIESGTDQDYKKDGKDQCPLNVRDGAADSLRAVAEQIDMHGPGDRLFQLRQHRLHLIDHLNGIRAGLAIDQQQFGVLTVEPCAGARIDGAVDHLREIFNRDGRPVLVGDNDLAELAGVEQLVVGVERILLVRALQVAFRIVERGGAERGFDLGKAKAPGRQSLWVDLNGDRRLLLAPDRNLSHARYRRQRLSKDRIGILIDLIDRHRVGMDGVDENWPIGRVGLAVGGRIRQIFVQQAARRVDGRLHVGRGAVDLTAQVEL